MVLRHLAVYPHTAHSYPPAVGTGSLSARSRFGATPFLERVQTGASLRVLRSELFSCYNDKKRNGRQFSREAEGDHGVYGMFVKNPNRHASQEPEHAIRAGKHPVGRRTPVSRNHCRHGRRNDRFVRAYAEAPKRRSRQRCPKMS